MKKILLFDTAIATTNLGDEIILDSVKEGLSAILYDSLIFRLGTHIENYSKKQLGKDNWKYKVLCQNADYKFICGTNLFSGSLKGKFPQWMLNPKNSKLYQNAVCVGIGKINNFKTIDRYTKRLYLKCLSKEYQHSVRDESTKKAMEMIGLKAINTGCPTLWSLNSEKCAQIPTKKADKAILSVSGYPEQVDWIADQKLVDCVLKNYTTVYAWIQTVMDKQYLSSLKNTKNIQCIYSLKKYKDILKLRNIDYIGTRLHGGVYALQHSCRAIVIAIDERAIGFYESNKLPIVYREEIEKSLDMMINSQWETTIQLNQKAIDKFINQFI